VREGIIETLTAAAEFELNDERGKGFGWDRIREHWYAWLERLASDFARGRTEVDPKLGAETCRSCHLAALCRVAAAPADLVEEGADAD
jgi:hypothetical protein